MKKHFALLAVLLIQGCDFPFGEIHDAKEKVRETMLDPSAAKFRDVEKKNGFICGHVNGKNKFGAYTGFKAFYFTNSTSGWRSLRWADDESVVNTKLWVINCFSECDTPKCEIEKAKERVAAILGWSYQPNFRNIRTREKGDDSHPIFCGEVEANPKSGEYWDFFVQGDAVNWKHEGPIEEALWNLTCLPYEERTEPTKGEGE